MFFKSFFSSISLAWAIISPVYAKPSSRSVIPKKEFWQAIHESYPAALEGKHIPPTYLTQCKNKKTPLNQAILNQDTAMVRLLIARGADVNYADEEQNTPLHAAVIVKSEEMLALLLQSPVHLDSRDRCDRTPLFVAIENGHYDLVVKLVSKGANKEIGGKIKEYNQGDHYRTPLQLAIESHPAIAAYLIQQGVNLYEKGKKGHYPIVDAVFYKREELVDRMVAQGVPLFYSEEVGMTVLHAAATHPADGLKRYVDLAPPGKQDQQDEYGNTPLHYAASGGMPETVALLLAREANPHIANKLGYQPLHKVVDHPNTIHQLIIARLLLEKGADVNALHHQFTVLGYAVLQGKMELVTLLLNDKANIEQLPTNPLYFKRSIPEKLFSDQTKLINSKTGLLHLAICRGHTAIAKFLIAYNPKPDFLDQRDSFNRTPLHYAALLGDVDIVYDLLVHGARLDIREQQEGYTPLAFAKKMILCHEDDEQESIYVDRKRVIQLLENWEKEQKQKAKTEKLKQKKIKKEKKN